MSLTFAREINDSIAIVAAVFSSAPSAASTSSESAGAFRLKNYLLDLQTPPAPRDSPPQLITDSIAKDSRPDRCEHGEHVVRNIGAVRIHQRIGYDLVGIEIEQGDGGIHCHDVFRHIVLWHDLCSVQLGP